MLLQELNIFPTMAHAREHSIRPLGGCGVQVILDLNAVRFLEMSAEHRIGEADSHAYVIRSKEWVVPAGMSVWLTIAAIKSPLSPIVHIRWSPSEDICV